jgi:hypothetical protein
MNKPAPAPRPRFLLLLCLTLLAACAAPATPTTLIPTVPAATPIAPAPTVAATPTLAGVPPRVGAITADRATLGRYERIELTTALTATYDNPYDQAQVALSASFQSPSGATREVPGFWDGRDAWMVRFTPDEIGAWSYTIHVRDRFGTADSAPSNFDVTTSDRHGWLQIASWHDPKLSPRYLVYHDGTPFYGIGRCEAFTLADARTDASGDLNTLKRMHENGENLVVWWPHYSYTFFSNSATNYERVDMQLIDSYLASAERLGITVVYTIWDHNLLRGDGHPWGRGDWGRNGFRQLTPGAADFFTDEQSWHWQENLYRYIIARWGYSPSILWMTVSELDGTTNSRLDPTLVHNGIWAGLASGAAITPLRWLGRGAWGRTRPRVMAQLRHLGTFVADIPFPSLNLQPAQLHADGTGLTARGLSSDSYVAKNAAGGRVSVMRASSESSIITPACSSARNSAPTAGSKRVSTTCTSSAVARTRSISVSTSRRAG